jgi:short-subunit dehydrogenase
MTNMNGTAVITGASSGIGKVYADRLARRGHNLTLIARREKLLTEYADVLQSKYAVVVNTIAADLSQDKDIARIETALVRDASISLLVNNAGTATLAPSMTIEPNARGAMTDLNVTALVRLSLAALAGFKARNCGTLINIGSTLGFHSLPGSALYSATKGYVLNFTRGLQDELAATNIVVQLVLPGATATDLWDISGVPLSALDPAHVMSVDDCVDAALVGLDLGEKITMPSLEDNTLLAQYDASRLALFAASQSSRPASRYGGTVRRMANAR